MEETLVLFQTAKLAKEIGFKEMDHGFYYVDGQLSYCQKHSPVSKDCLDYNKKQFCFAPTQSLFQEFMLEKYQIYVNVERYVQSPMGSGWLCTIEKIEFDKKNPPLKSWMNFNRKRVFEWGLQEACKTIKEQIKKKKS